MARWFIFLHGNFGLMEDWEHRIFNDAVAEGKNVLQYVWYYDYRGERIHVPYTVDLVAMTQTNDTTGFVRELLYLETEGSQSITSPFLLRWS